MASDMDLEFETLFARIQSPHTAKRFKLLSSATTQDLALTFQPEKTKFIQQEGLLGFNSESKAQPK